MALSCEASVTIQNPDGTRSQVPLSELRQSAEQEAGDETWTEKSRTTTTVNISGVEIERIETVTFSRPSGSDVTLEFDNS